MIFIFYAVVSGLLKITDFLRWIKLIVIFMFQ